jgi:hypothetical protein
MSRKYNWDPNRPIGLIPADDNENAIGGKRTLTLFYVSNFLKPKLI